MVKEWLGHDDTDTVLKGASIRGRVRGLRQEDLLHWLGKQLRQLQREIHPGIAGIGRIDGDEKVPERHGRDLPCCPRASRTGRG